MARSIIRFAELYSQYAKTYFYQFSYDGAINGNLGPYFEGANAVGHSAEIAYLFCVSQTCNHSKFPEQEQVTADRLVKIWTNFAKTQ